MSPGFSGTKYNLMTNKYLASSWKWLGIYLSLNYIQHSDFCTHFFGIQLKLLIETFAFDCYQIINIIILLYVSIFMLISTRPSQ